MLDYFIDELINDTVTDAEDNIKDDILAAIRDALLEHTPDEAKTDTDIYDWIDIPDITADAFYSGFDFAESVSQNIDNLTIYTKDCNEIISECGFSESLKIYMEWCGEIDKDNIPTESEVASQILYEDYYPSECDVIDIVADNIVGSAELDELISLFKKGLLVKVDEE